MKSHSDDYYLELCKQLVEEKLGWGSSETWSHSDFIEASERISEETGVSLSVTTIKRIFGKVKHSGSPASSTLNALAVYLGYVNWRDFKISKDVQQNEVPEVEKEVNVTSVPLSGSLRKHFSDIAKKKKIFIPYISTLILLICAFYFLAGKEKEKQAVNYENTVFSSEPVAQGLPNTVIFNYDITAFDFDSAFIQQNWDARRRQQINKEDRQMTSVYYYPGHFHAKLILNDQVIKEHGLLIPTEGWLGIVEPEDNIVPVYILPNQLIQKEALHVSQEVLKQKNIDSRNGLYLSYSNSRDFGVDGDNFILETAIKNNIEEGGSVCKESLLLLDGEEGVVWVPLAVPGCVGNLNLRFGNVFVDGKTTDLSAFGADLSQWNHLKYVVKNQHVEIFLNDNLIYSIGYEKPIRKIYGINFKFAGAGSVDYLRLKNEKEELVYVDEFDGKVAEIPSL